MLSFVWFCNLCWNTTGKWISTLPFANQFFYVIGHVNSQYVYYLICFFTCKLQS
jgi:hypothetical protein